MRLLPNDPDGRRPDYAGDWQARRHRDRVVEVGCALVAWTVVAFGLGFACGKAAGAEPRWGGPYVRHEAKYTIRWGGRAIHVAARVNPRCTPAERWLVAREVEKLNGLRRDARLHKGDALRVPVYRRAAGGIYLRRWHRAALACNDGARLASVAFVVALSVKEGGWGTKHEDCVCGVIGADYVGMQTQFNNAVRIAREEIGDGTLWPTKKQVRAVANRFPTPETGVAEARDGWTRDVWSLYRALR